MFSLTEVYCLVATLFLLITGLVLNRVLKQLKFKLSSPELADEERECCEDLHNYRNLLCAVSLISLTLLIAFHLAKIYAIENHVLDWLNLLVRWGHVVLGISWIGASFYFIFLENSLNRTDNLRDELAGNLWAVHGGGFYYVEKYKTAPKAFPKTLHWFKYEAYFTWASGIFLLTLVYYLNAGSYMIDPAVSNISGSTSVFIGIGTLLFGWIVYDLLCKSSLLQKKKAFAILGFLIVTAISFFLSRYLSGRAAFMHIGSLLGTLMAGNVFFVIIPSQKALVKAARLGKPVDPELGKYAGLRSLHNNYMTLPVIYVMISNHFPANFGNQYNWAILAGLTLMSVAVRHFINLHEKGQKAVWMLPFSAVCLIALVIVTAPASSPVKKKNKAIVAFSQVQPVIQKRCVVCHSSKPSDDIQTVAPNGIMFDTPEQIKIHSDRILVRAVETKTMPQGNKTVITEAERELIGDWIEQGAVIK